MGEIDGVEIHHDVAEIDEADVVHAWDKEDLLVGFVGVGSFLAKNGFQLLVEVVGGIATAVPHFLICAELKLNYSCCDLKNYLRGLFME